jgi:hypothetical protein
MTKEKFEEEVLKTEKTITMIRFVAWIFIAIGFIFLVIGLVYWIKDKQLFNEVGDFVGGIAGSLWALAGLFFIYLAFLGQKIEIKYQQEELRLNREELSKSKEALQAQANIMLNQQFDTTFFNLLDNHRKLVESFKFSKKIKSITSIFKNDEKNTSKELSGYEALNSICGSLKWYLKEYNRFLRTRNIFEQNITRSNPISQIKRYVVIEILYNEVFNIVDFILKKIADKNQKFYLDTLFSNLSNQEKFLLTAYNVNCSQKYLKELDFVDYMKYDFVNFSNEEYFIKEAKVFLDTEISKGLLILFNNYFEDEDKFHLHLINTDEKKITHVHHGNLSLFKKWSNIIISKVTEENFPEEFKKLFSKEIYVFEFPIVLQVENPRFNFMLYYACIIKYKNQTVYVEDYKFSTWIQDYFNNKESQQS